MEEEIVISVKGLLSAMVKGGLSMTICRLMCRKDASWDSSERTEQEKLRQSTF